MFSYTLVKTALVGMWSTIWTSYICSVYNGSVPPPSQGWPMISDTWVAVPGNYLSRLFMPTFIGVWAVYCWMVSMWLNTYDCVNKLQNRVMQGMVQIGYAGFVTCIAINEDDNDFLHSIGALVFFVSQGIFCSHVVQQLIRMRKPNAMLCLFLNMLYWSDLAAFLFMSQDFHDYHSEIAVAEWMAVALVSTFHMCIHPRMEIIIEPISEPSKEKQMFIVSSNNYERM